MKRTKSIWELHREEQNDALMAQMGMVYDNLRSRCPWYYRVYFRFLDCMQWIIQKLFSDL